MHNLASLLRSILPVTLISILSTACHSTGHKSRPSDLPAANANPLLQNDRFEAPFEQNRQVIPPFNRPPVEDLSNPNSESPKIVHHELYNPNENDIPQGVALKGQPNTMLSPYAPTAGKINTLNLPPGTKVRCPYTGKIIRVPLTPTEEAPTPTPQSTPQPAKTATGRNSPPKLDN